MFSQPRFPNPYYYAHKMREPAPVPKTSREGTSYFMIEDYLPPVSEIPAFTFQGQPCHLDDHHLTVFPEYGEEDVVSPLHYSARFNNIVLRVYFDRDGKYLSCRICLDSVTGEEEMDLSDTDQSALQDVAKNLAKKYALPGIAQLSADLWNNRAKLYTIKKEKLDALAETSKSGTETLEYKALLDTTLQAFEDHEKLLFAPDPKSKKDEKPELNPNRSIKNLLISFRQKLNAPGNKQAQKKKIRSLPEADRAQNREDHFETKHNSTTPGVITPPAVSKTRPAARQPGSHCQKIIAKVNS